MGSLSRKTERKLNQWNRNAEHAITRLMHKGEFDKLVSQRWANGQTMTGIRGQTAAFFIPRERAVELYKAGKNNNWKWIVDENGRIIT